MYQLQKVCQRAPHHQGFTGEVREQDDLSAVKENTALTLDLSHNFLFNIETGKERLSSLNGEQQMEGPLDVPNPIPEPSLGVCLGKY